MTNGNLLHTFVYMHILNVIRNVTVAVAVVVLCHSFYGFHFLNVWLAFFVAINVWQTRGVGNVPLSPLLKSIIWKITSP